MWHAPPPQKKTHSIIYESIPTATNTLNAIICAFDRVFCPHSRAFDQRFSKKSNARGFALAGGIIAVGIDSYIRGNYYLTVVSYSYEILKCLRILQGKRSRFAKPNSSNRYNKIHKPRGKQIICKRVSCCRDEIYILAWTRW